MDRLRARAGHIVKTLAEAGHRALFAGGCVRDTLLGTEPHDYDIATDALPEDVSRLFDHVIPMGVQFAVQTIVFPEGHFEVATFRKDENYLDGRHPESVSFCSEEQDALRRDFTINALFFDPLEDKLVDYVDGRADLKAGIIRAVGDPEKRFGEDHLRLLRAVRFAARLNFEIEPGTFAAMRSMAHKAALPSAERVRDELMKMLTEGNSHKAMKLLDSSGMLDAVLPEVARMKNIEQPPEFHPEGDVFDHTLMMLGEMDARTEKKTRTLAMAVLLHDAGKPLTQTFEDRIRFNLHDKVGAHQARSICTRLRMSRTEIERTEWLVKNHMRLASAPEMRESKLKRFVRKEGFSELVDLCELDCLCSHLTLDTIKWVRDYVANLKPEESRPKPLLTGDDLKQMGYEPGPIFSKILRRIEDAQLEGKLKSTGEAKEFVLNNWPL